MTIAFGQSAWLDTITDFMEKQIASSAGVPRDRVFTYYGNVVDLMDDPVGEQFIVLGAPSLPVDDRFVTGGGAEETIFRGLFPVHVMARLATDRKYQDSKQLREKSRGLIELVRKTIRAIQVYWQVSSGQSSFLEPPRIQRVNINGRLIPGGWGHAEISLEASFRTNFAV